MNVSANGPLHAHRDAPWQHLHPVALHEHVQRLTAPNASLMTGPGTNSYLVGSPATGYAVIDPGPADPEHVQRLWQAARHADGRGGHVRCIVCTHSHADHAPGAWLLKALCPHQPPVYGLPSAPTAKPNAVFTPDDSLAHLQRLDLPAQSATDAVDCPATISLLAVHTPGHAANHVCLLLPHCKVLFSGDHILHGSTTVVDPPDGNMARYLDSLDLLLHLCREHGVAHILPAHGHVIADNPQGVERAITKLKAHRLQREAKVAQAMQTKPDGTLQDWLNLAYDDVPQTVRHVALRSLRAHLEHLGWVQPQDGPYNQPN